MEVIHEWNAHYFPLNLASVNNKLIHLIISTATLLKKYKIVSLTFFIINFLILILIKSNKNVFTKNVILPFIFVIKIHNTETL
jgi:hypothetical protein